MRVANRIYCYCVAFVIDAKQHSPLRHDINTQEPKVH